MTDIDRAAREYLELQSEIRGLKKELNREREISSDYYHQMLNVQNENSELIEALEEATKWIPVSERLPEEGQEVLGYNPEWIDEDFNHTGVCLCYWNRGFNDAMWFRTKWDNDQDMWWPAEEAPTHWLQKPTIDTPKADRLLEKYRKK